jgi:hypothetical protein
VYEYDSGLLVTVWRPKPLVRSQLGRLAVDLLPHLADQAFPPPTANMAHTTDPARNVVKVNLVTQEFHTCIVVASVVYCEVK